MIGSVKILRKILTVAVLFKYDNHDQTTAFYTRMDEFLKVLKHAVIV